jgi:hypothetical protein
MSSIEKELSTYINNIEKDYKSLEDILQNKLLLKDNKLYINYKLKVFQEIFKSLENSKAKLFNHIDDINKNTNKGSQHLHLLSKYPNVIDPKFNTKFSSTDLIQQYIGINSFKELSQKLYSTYATENNNLDNNSLALVENKYSIWKLSAMQKVLRNFISPETPYYGILIVHGTGVGKTCTAITIAENFKDYVAEHNTKIQVIRPDEFKRQVFEISKLKSGEPDMQCTGTTYIDQLNDQLAFMESVSECENSKNKETQDKACRKVEKVINKKIAEYYDFKSRVIWAKTILKLLKLKTKGLSGITKQRKLIETIRQEFNNSVIIIDEAHNLRNLDVDISLDDEDEDDNANTNKNKTSSTSSQLNLIQILEMVSLIAQNVRIVLLSATPMYDRASDIVPLFNLLLLNDHRPRITEKELFTDDYGTLVKDTGSKKINKVSRGYVSYVRGNDPLNFPLRLNADITLPQTDIFDISKYPSYDITGKKKIQSNDKIKHFTLVNCPLSKEHSNAIINKDKLTTTETKEQPTETTSTQQGETTYTEDDYKYSVAYSTELQLGNFMYKSPKDASGNFIETYGINGFNSCFTKGKSGSYEPISDSILTKFQQPELKKYGPKIAKILSSLEKATGPIAIYSNYIYGGIIPMVIALELAGYTRYDGVKEFVKSSTKPSKSKGQYVLYTGDKAMSKGGDKYVGLRSSMIKETNVKVFLFSSAGSEGLSLFGYREMHIMEPWHNINLMEQSIGRIIRNKSHHHLPPRERNATVYMYASTFSKEFQDRESIDLRIYSICEQKAIAIGNIETLLKSNAFDCPVTRELNIRNKDYYGKKVKILNSHGKILEISLEDIEYSRDTAYQKTGDYVCNVSSSNSKSTPTSKTVLQTTTTTSKISREYYVELRELRQLITKVLQYQGNLSYEDVMNIVKINLDISKTSRVAIIKKFITALINELKETSKNSIIINNRGELCKIFVFGNSETINSANSKQILRLLPLNKYDPNLDLLQQAPVPVKIVKKFIPAVDGQKLDITDPKYNKRQGVNLQELIELKQMRFKEFQKKEELNIGELFGQISSKVDYLKGVVSEDKQSSKFNFSTNFNMSNKMHVGKDNVLSAVFERLLINEKTFVCMYIVAKLSTVGYSELSDFEKSLAHIVYFQIVLSGELNFLKNLGSSKSITVKNYLDKESIISSLKHISSSDIKGVIVADVNAIKYYELDGNKKLDINKLISYNYLKDVYKDNKINLDKVLKSKYNKLVSRRISRLYGYLVYEKKFQQPKFKITDYISRGYKKSVKGIFCANKHIGEIEKIIGMLTTKKFIGEHELLKTDTKNKKIYCGDLEMFFRLRNSIINNSFGSRLDAGNIYFLNPEQYYIWQKFSNEF